MDIYAELVHFGQQVMNSPFDGDILCIVGNAFQREQRSCRRYSQMGSQGRVRKLAADIERSAKWLDTKLLPQNPIDPV